MNISSLWIIELPTFADYSSELTFKDETDAPIDIAGYIIKIVIEYADGENETEVEWSTGSGHITELLPTVDGKVAVDVPMAEIGELPFDWAIFKLYVGATASTLDLVYKGKIEKVG